MFFEDINIARLTAESGISTTAAIVLFWINRYVSASRIRGVVDRRGTPYSYASQETIAHKVGRSVRTVERATAELKRAGMIEVRRTRKFAHTFVCWQAIYAENGGSRTAKNGGSIEYLEVMNIDRGISSIYQGKPEQLTDRFAIDASTTDAEAPRPRDGTSSRRTASMPADGGAPCSTAEGRPAGQRMPTGARDRKKTAPTPRRPRRTLAERNAAREKYKRYLLGRLCGWAPFDADTMEEQGRLAALADMIADAAASGRQIIVNGVGLTAGQYWQTVKGIEYSEQITEMLDRIDTRRADSGVKNIRGYTLACAFNLCQQAEALRGAGWTHTASGCQGADSDRGNYGGEVDDGWMREYLAGA